jgi:xanthine/uracil/vitamin C permease (AzgA family)
MTSTDEIRTTTSSDDARPMTISQETTAGRRSRQLLGLTSALLALQVLNLAVFDDLRTDESAGALETFAKPQHLSSIVAVVLAVVLVARRHRHAARVAVVVAWIEIAAFTFFHGIPVQIGPAKPYWGDGSGDTLQWLGFLSIMACSAAIVVVGRKRP